MDAIVQIISNVGFPITMCLLLFWYIANAMKSMNTTLQAMQQTVENNTAVVQKLNDRLDKLEETTYDDSKEQSNAEL